MKFKLISKQKSYLSIHTYKGIDFYVIPSSFKFSKYVIDESIGFRFGFSWIGLMFWIFIKIKNKL